MSHLAASHFVPTPIGHETGLARILAEHQLTAVFQPIVEIATSAVVGYESFVRGPEHSELRDPGALFAAAAREGRVLELDAACRAAAVRGAIGAGLTNPLSLFVNVELLAATSGVREQLGAFIDQAQHRVRIVLEFTERALTERPAEVLQAVSDLRSRGAQIALDNVGLDPRSLALMPFLRPEVIKLDMSLIQGELTTTKARAIHAVRAHAEAFGGLILAEGIETDEHLERAQALGATHGQGWLFGRPGPGPFAPSGAALAHFVTTETDRRQTPYAIACASGAARGRAPEHILLALSRQLDLQAEGLGPEAVLLGNVQHDRLLSDTRRRSYSRLAERAAFVGLVGDGVSAEPAPGVRGGTLAPGEPLTREWSICVVSPHFAALLAATDLGTAGSGERRFDYCLTYDRKVALRAARETMGRIAPPA